MRAQILFFLLTPALVLSQKIKKTTIDIGMFDDEYEIIKINKKRIKNGSFQRSDSEESTIYISGTYSNDLRSSIWTFSNSTGILAKGKYDDGKKNGLWEYNHPSEQINFIYDHSYDSVISYQHNNKLHEVWMDGSWKKMKIDRIPLSTEFDTKFHEEINYPLKAMRVGIEGKCLLEIIVNEFGDVESKSIIKDIGAGTREEILRSFDESWVSSTPAIKDNKPIKVKRYLLVEYKTPPVWGDSDYKLTWSWR